MKGTKGRRESDIERETDAKTKMKTRGMTKTDARDMETERIWN